MATDSCLVGRSLGTLRASTLTSPPVWRQRQEPSASSAHTCRQRGSRGAAGCLGTTTVFGRMPHATGCCCCYCIPARCCIVAFQEMLHSTHLLWLLCGVVVDPAHAEGMLVCPLSQGAICPHQLVKLVGQLNLKLGTGRLQGAAAGQHHDDGSQSRLVRLRVWVGCAGVGMLGQGLYHAKHE